VIAKRIADSGQTLAQLTTKETQVAATWILGRHRNGVYLWHSCMPKLVEFRHLPELQNQSRTISSLLLHSFHLEIQITKMITLPVELQRLCLKPLHRNVDALKAVRLVNRHLNVLTTELLFRTVVLNHTEKSASRFVGILNSSLEHVVRHVIINTSEDPRGHYEQESEIGMPFAEAISREYRSNFQKNAPRAITRYTWPKLWISGRRY
jgi:hypothetical protein